MKRLVLVVLLTGCSLAQLTACTTTGSTKDPNAMRVTRVSERPADRPGRY